MREHVCVVAMLFFSLLLLMRIIIVIISFLGDGIILKRKMYCKVDIS